jgi:hypothetical protein
MSAPNRDGDGVSMALGTTKGDEDARLPAPNRDCQGADVFTGVFKGCSYNGTTHALACGGSDCRLPPLRAASRWRAGSDNRAPSAFESVFNRADVFNQTSIPRAPDLNRRQ